MIKYKGASKKKPSPAPRGVRKLSADLVIVEEEVTLKRDLGAFGSFSIGYTDVGAGLSRCVQAYGH